MRFRPFLLVLLISCFPLLLLLNVTGCSCTQDPIQARLDEAKKKLEDEKKKKAKPKPDYEMGLLTVQPNNLVDRQFFVKPGHLSSVTVDMIANNFDIKGELVIDPLDLDGVAYTLGNSRPVVLPKESKRNPELILKYPPLIPGEDRADLKTFSCRMNAEGGRLLQSTPARLSRMPAHQFYFVVLAKSQDSYRYLSQLPSFKPTTSALPGDDPQAFYRLVLPPVIQRTPLPSTSLAWTSLAYIVWDDMSLDALTLEQQQAMIDWLHWGGQLIVSGPGSLTPLKNSFLEPYLPVEGGESYTLGQGELANFLSFAEGEGWRGPERISKPWECQILKPKLDAEGVDRLLMNTGGNILMPLIVERSVGRGRVVVTGFRLSQPEIAEWRSDWPKFDEIFNGFILRRNPREWQYMSSDEVAAMAWRVDGKNLMAQSPREASRMSYFSRDTGAARYKPKYLEGTGTFDPDTFDRFEGTGPAAWDDFNDVAHAARNTIEEAAGIKVPERMFVVKMLAVYLFVLVPLNWCFFGLMRKLEWAWIAVPIITVVFTGVVVKMAQLNIGFARSRTEIAVVEVQGEHPRAHMTRYTALYTSLTTRYDVRLTDPGGAVQPLSGKEPVRDFQMASRKTLWMFRDDQVRLSGFEVGSNSRGILHAEQMFAMGGSIKVVELTDEGVKVSNGTKYELRDAQVIGPAGVAKLGNLSPGETAQGKFVPLPIVAKPEVDADEGVEGGVADTALRTLPTEKYGDAIRLDDLVAIAGQVTDKSVRLVAWSDEILDGMEVEPQASQNQHANLFVVHLRSPEQPKANVDQFLASHDDPQAKLVRETFLKKPTKPVVVDEIEPPPP